MIKVICFVSNIRFIKNKKKRGVSCLLTNSAFFELDHFFTIESANCLFFCVNMG